MGPEPQLDPALVEKLGPRLRYRIRYEVGFACPDVDDLVQETLKRFLEAFQAQKIRTPESAGAFVNGICRNVIWEYRRQVMRDGSVPENPPEPSPERLHAGDLLELKDSLSHALAKLSERDRQVLRAFYLEERSPEEILQTTGLTMANFRVVLCRAKERFREIYQGEVKSGTVSKH
jgi:RNA polymerase sigma-70 factor (ECF subfamily)